MSVFATTRSPPAAAAALERSSHFREASMDEYTLASSTRGDDDAGTRRGRARALALRLWDAAASLTDMDHCAQAKAGLRLVNGVAHLGLASVLLAIMGEFMVRSNRLGRAQRPQAIAVTTFVAVDCALDIYHVVRVRQKWQGWATGLRLLLALGYLAQFLVYVGYRRVFPPGYAYWGMGAEYSGPVVYLCIWFIGLWDLFHVTAHRHSLGRDLRRYADNAPRLFGRRPPHPPSSGDGTRQQATTSRRHPGSRRTPGPTEPTSVVVTRPTTAHTRQSRGGGGHADNNDEIAINLDVLASSSGNDQKDKNGMTMAQVLQQPTATARAVSPSSSLSQTLRVGSSSSSSGGGDNDESSRRTGTTLASGNNSRRTSDEDGSAGMEGGYNRRNSF